jgi:hypothetical protein
VSQRRGLGRLPSPPDSRDYRLSNYLPLRWPDFSTDMAVYATGPALNQGSTPHCVGFSGVGWMNAEPVPNTLREDDGHALYWDCKAIDGYPGDGTYVRTLARVLKSKGRISGYAFGSVLDARRFILTEGPVVFGIPWLEGFFYPDSEGVIKPWGELCGGHAILAYGADPVYCWLQNSWGKSWGKGGTCRISWADLEAVFGDHGEAMAAVELPADWVRPEPWWLRAWHWILRLLRG